MIRLTDERDKVTNYTYDYKGRLVTETNPLSQTTSYTYDDLGGGGCACGSSAGAGKPASKTDSASRTTYYKYDSADRLTTTTYSGTTETVVNSYDSWGRLATRFDNRLPASDFPTQTFSYTYNNINQVTQVTFPDSATVKYTYDGTTRRLRAMTDPDNNGTTYTYATASNNKKLESIDHALFGTDYLNYNTKGLLSSEAMPNATYNEWYYDSLNRVSSIIHFDGQVNDFHDEAYTYNGNSLRTRIDYNGALPANNVDRREWAYDAALRLAKEDAFSYSTRLYGYWYTYDPAGNRSQLNYFDGSTTQTIDYSYNDYHQLDAWWGSKPYDGINYQYDTNGNMISATDIINYIERVHAHNRENRLTNYEVDREGMSEDVNLTYTYDASGRLLMRTATNGTKEKYYYDGINLLLVKEKPSGGVWRTKKVNELKQAETGQIIGHRQYTAWSGSVPTTYDDLFYHYDLLGNVTAMTDSSGNVTNHYDMEAFGNVKSGSQTGVHLTTKEWDGDSGLYYFNARWYSTVASFIERSPVSVEFEAPYNYAAQNPTFYIDPTGEFLVGSGVGCLLGAATSIGFGVAAKLGTGGYDSGCHAAAEVACRGLGGCLVGGVAGAVGGGAVGLLRKAVEQAAMKRGAAAAASMAGVAAGAGAGKVCGSFCEQIAEDICGPINDLMGKLGTHGSRTNNIPIE